MLLNKFTKPQGVPILKVISDAGIANPHVGDGRLIPIAVLDCSSLPELSTFIELHKHTPPGDVVSTWAIPRITKQFMYLFLNFTKPSQIKTVIEFNTYTQFALIDGIIQSRALIIRSSVTGEKFSENIDAPSIMFEVPEETTPDYWEALYFKRVKNKLKNSGVPKAHLSELAEEHIKRMRELWARRLNIT
ncbi:hypothetical protein [uncultured Tolumonas sp.]|uniref:hypothetical protein n=1 Tax=uncultured Tolumonas sp. TaxID=263765 RepID=UPI00292D2A66|nr:hypothetical protein [uncultured Tolumonas sp.]